MNYFNKKQQSQTPRQGMPVNPSTNMNSPMHSPMNNPTNDPMNDPINNPMSAPMNNPVNNPVNIPMNNPANNPMSAPMNNPANNPMNAPMNNPANNPMNAPMNNPANNPMNAPMNNPANNPMNAPMNNPMNNPMNVSVNMPSFMAMSGQYNGISGAGSNGMMPQSNFMNMDDFTGGISPDDLPMNHYNWPISGNEIPMEQNIMSPYIPMDSIPMMGNMPMMNNMPMMGNMPMTGNMPMMNNMPMMSNMPMMNNMPMMSNMPMMDNMPMPSLDNYGTMACPPTSIEAGDLQKALELIKEAVSGEKKDRLFYEYLISVAPSDEEKSLLKGIRDDEIRHFSIFRDLYKELSGSSLPVSSDGDFHKPKSYCDGLKDALLGEQKAIQKYRKILFILVDRRQINKLVEIITDEIRHGSIYNYLYSKNKCMK